MDYVEKLRSELWQKVFKSVRKEVNRTNCDRIVKVILTETEQNLDWETVRDFYKGNRETSKRTLNKISAYVLDDKDATYLNFQDWCDEEELIARKESPIDHVEKYHQTATKKTRRRRITLISLIGIVILLLIGNSPLVHQLSQKSTYVDDFKSKDKGWKLLYIDNGKLKEDNWAKPNKEWKVLPECAGDTLIMKTIEGDLWGDREQYSDTGCGQVLVRRNKSKNFFIVADILNFYPLHNFQSAGIIIMQDDDNYIRMTVSSSNLPPEKKDSLNINRIIIQLVSEIGGKVDEVSHHTLWDSRLSLGIEKQLKKLRLRILTREGKAYASFSYGKFSSESTRFSNTFSEFIGKNYKENGSNGSKIRDGEIEMIFTPKYVGIIAFKGVSNNVQEGRQTPIGDTPDNNLVMNAVFDKFEVGLLPQDY